MPVGDIYQVTNEFTYQNNPNAYNWHVRVTAEAAPEDVVDDLAAFGQEREDNWLLIHNPSCVFRCITVRQVYPTSSLPSIVATDNAGNRSCIPPLTHLPGQCSCVVTRYGDLGNPTQYNRGRDFITGQCSGDQTNGVFSAGVASYLEEVCDMYAAMGNTYVAGGNEYDIGIYSPSRAKPENWPVVPSVPPYFWPLIHVRGRSLVRTQRRRQPLDPCEEVCDQAITAASP